MTTENNVPAQASDEPSCPFCGKAPRYLAHQEGTYTESIICDACHFSLPPTAWRTRSGNAVQASDEPMPVLFPPMPLPVVKHAAVGDLFDRMAMHQYALRYADLVVASKNTDGGT